MMQRACTAALLGLPMFMSSTLASIAIKTPTALDYIPIQSVQAAFGPTYNAKDPRGEYSDTDLAHITFPIHTTPKEYKLVPVTVDEACAGTLTNPPNASIGHWVALVASPQAMMPLVCANDQKISQLKNAGAKGVLLGVNIERDPLPGFELPYDRRTTLIPTVAISRETAIFLKDFHDYFRTNNDTNPIKVFGERSFDGKLRASEFTDTLTGKETIKSATCNGRGFIEIFFEGATGQLSLTDYTVFVTDVFGNMPEPEAIREHGYRFEEMTIQSNEYKIICITGLTPRFQDILSSGNWRSIILYDRLGNPLLKGSGLTLSDTTVKPIGGSLAVFRNSYSDQPWDAYTAFTTKPTPGFPSIGNTFCPYATVGTIAGPALNDTARLASTHYPNWWFRYWNIPESVNITRVSLAEDGSGDIKREILQTNVPTIYTPFAATKTVNAHVVDVFRIIGSQTGRVYHHGVIDPLGTGIFNCLKENEYKSHMAIKYDTNGHPKSTVVPGPTIIPSASTPSSNNTNTSGVPTRNSTATSTSKPSASPTNASRPPNDAQLMAPISAAGGILIAMTLLAF